MVRRDLRLWLGVVGFVSLVAVLALIAANRDPGGAKGSCADQRAVLADPDRIPLHLFVSNQSFEIDPVRIEVDIDGEVVVCQAFFVESQHNWIEFDLAFEPGTHTLRAVAPDTGAALTAEFDHEFEQWAVLDFWFHPGEEPEHFTFNLWDEPVGFD